MKVQRNGYTFANESEALFFDWIVEAHELGILIGYTYPCPSMSIIPNKRIAMIKYSSKLRIPKQSDKHLLNGLNYTPDFQIELSDKIFKLTNDFVNYQGVHGTILEKNKVDRFFLDIDIKSKAGNKFGNNQTATTFPIVQKLLYHINNHFVSKVIVEDWFKKTWCPNSKMWMKNRREATKTKLGKQCKTKDQIQVLLQQETYKDSLIQFDKEK